MFDLSTLATGPLMMVQARHGPFITLASDHHGIGALLRHYGEFCESEIRLLCSVLENDDTFIEVGGNIGTHTVPIARHLSSAGKVIVYEPQPIIATLLETNLAINGIRNANVRVCGAGSSYGNFSLPVIDYRNSTNTGAISLLEGSAGAASIPVEPIDGLDLNSPVKLIKIDVEGMESEVLKGARETISKNRPIIYFENNPLPRETSIYSIDYTISMGYSCFFDVKSLHDHGNFNHQSNYFFSDIGNSSNVLAIPNERLDHFNGVVRKFRLEAIKDSSKHPLIRA